MTATRSSGRPGATRSPRPMSPPSDAPRPRAEPERLHGALRAHHQGLLPRAHGPDRRGLAASRRPRVRRALPPRTESPGARPSPDPAAVDGPATPSSRPVPPAARWDVALRLSVSSVIHDRPSTPRSSFWTVRAQGAVADALAIVRTSRGSQKWRPASPTLSENRPAIRLVERGKDSKVGRRRALAFEPLPSCLPTSFAARP